MKKVVQRFLYCFGKIIGWRWLSMIAGVALIAACSGKTDKAKVSTGNVKDSERVTCYEPVVDTSVVRSRSLNSASDEEFKKAKDSSVQQKQVPLHPCYVPVKPKE